MIRDVSDLEIYTTSLNLLKEIYDLNKKLPSTERDVADQLRRCSKSIAANIAEGFAKQEYPKEFKRYLLNALGSSDETVTHLRTLYITTPVIRSDLITLASRYKILSKRIRRLYNVWVSDN